MSEQLHQLMELFFKTSPGIWDAVPVVRPDRDDDPMCEYVIQSHKDGLTERYFTAEPESEALAAVHSENSANAEFISLAHNFLPKILNQLDRMEKLEHQWEQGISESIEFFEKLTETAVTLDKLCPQISRVKVDSTDQPLLEVLDQVERLAASLKPYLKDDRKLSRSRQIDQLIKFYYGVQAESKYGITRVDQENRYRYLFASNRAKQGLFLVDDTVMGSAFTRETFKEIINEAKVAGLSAEKWHIFAATCPYSGPGIEFYQLPDKLLKGADMMASKHKGLDKPYIRFLTTSELLALVVENIAEASLRLSGGLRSTHFLDCEDGIINDDGCDGEFRKVTPEQFLMDYPDSLGRIWRIDQLIPQ